MWLMEYKVVEAFADGIRFRCRITHEEDGWYTEFTKNWHKKIEVAVDGITSRLVTEDLLIYPETFSANGHPSFERFPETVYKTEDEAIRFAKEVISNWCRYTEEARARRLG